MLISKGSTIYDQYKNEYIIEEKIGGGGFSAVFKIRNKTSNEYYALKTFSSDFENNEELKTFQNEISKATTVESENVVQYNFFNDGEFFPELPPYIIMEFCEGGTLEDYIKEILKSGNSITNQEIKNIFLQLINGMTDINNKVVHRDIKLSNILLKDGILKISDFGISKSILDSTRTITFKGYGTKEYMAPEGWKMDSNTIKMDMYSMGIVFYQIATLLNYPYVITTGKIEEYMEAHLYGNVINPKKYNRDIDLNIESIILKMLEKEPAKRFNNWDEIRILIDTKISDKNTELLNRILEKRIAIDEENRKIEIANIKKTEELDEKKKIVSYSIYENMYQPIKELIEAFNMSYASGKIWISDYNISSNEKNEIQVNTISKKIMHIIIKTIVGVEFEEEYQDPFFGNYYKKKYRPQLEGKEILAWGAVYIDKLISYNLILVKDEESIYGKWYQIKNRISPFSRERRVTEIFAFDFNEIEDEIGKMNAIHIYTSTIEVFNKDELLEKFENII